MKIAITSTGNTLESEVDSRFGRCAYFIIYDTDSKNFEAISNSAVMESSGAGIKSAQTIKNTGAEILLTGNVGPKAMTALSAAKVGVAVGVIGKVQEAIDKFSTGEYKVTQEANVASHFGFKEE